MREDARKNGAISVQMRAANKEALTLDKEIKKHFQKGQLIKGGVGELTAQEQIHLNRLLQMPQDQVADIRNGTSEDAFDVFVRDLPKGIIDSLGRMRQHIDRLSTELRNSGAISENMKAVFDENVGIYLNRAYRIFDDPKWQQVVRDTMDTKKGGTSKVNPEMAQIWKSAIDEYIYLRADREASDHAMAQKPEDVDDGDWIDSDAYNKLKARHKATNQTVSSEVAAQELSGLLNEYMKKDNGFEGSSTLGSKSSGILTHRKDMPDALRQLMGEYHSPITNYTRTVNKVAMHLGNQRFQQQVREEGLGKWLFTSREEAPPGFNVEIAGKKSESLDGLAGLFTTPEIAEAWQGYNKVTPNHPAWRFLSWFNGRTKMAATMGSLQTANVNLTGIPMMASNAGHFLITDTLKPEFWGKAMDAVRHAWHDDPVTSRLGTTTNQAETQALRERARALGVLDEEIISGDIQKSLREAGISSFEGKSPVELTSNVAKAMDFLASPASHGKAGKAVHSGLSLIHI